MYHILFYLDFRRADRGVVRPAERRQTDGPHQPEHPVLPHRLVGRRQPRDQHGILSTEGKQQVDPLPGCGHPSVTPGEFNLTTLTNRELFLS